MPRDVEREKRFKEKKDLSNDDSLRFIEHKGWFVKGNRMVEPDESYYTYLCTRCDRVIEEHGLVTRCPDCDRGKVDELVGQPRKRR